MTLTSRAMLRALLIAGGALAALPAWAASAPTTTAGPGRITCRSATNCLLSIGTSAAMNYHINVAALPKPDQQRLVKQCTPKGKPCVASVDGTETGKGLTLKATAIKFYN